MEIFKQLTRKSKSTLQIGLAENKTHRCFVWLMNEAAQFEWQPRSEPFYLPQAVSSAQKFAIIRPVPEQYIWKKIVFLPMEYDELMIYKQIIQILKQELPLELHQVHFDYQVELKAEKKAQKISLFALRKSYSEALSSRYPTILDSELHCFHRALQFLKPEQSFASEALEEHISAIDEALFPANILDKHCYLIALGASLWNGKA